MTPHDTSSEAPVGTMAGIGQGSYEGLAARVSALEAARAADSARARPWYRQASVLIAALALVFSMTATWFGEQRAAERDESAARVELSQLIQRLTSLPRENQELQARYPGQTRTLNSLSGMIQTQSAVLARQAYDIIGQISDQVSGTEYLAVGDALTWIGDFGRAEALYNKGLAKDNDASSAAALWRSKGVLNFSIRQLGPGRAAMANAIKAYEGQQAIVAATANTVTEWQWAGIEQSLGACEAAKTHLDRAQQYLDQLPMSEFKIRMMASLSSVTSNSTDTCPAL